MRIVVMVNGSLSSHTTALYALYYAKELKASLDFIYLKEFDAVSYVENHIQDIKDLADSFEISNEFIAFDLLHELHDFLLKRDIATLFCSTRKNATIYHKSFIQKIIRLNVPLDIAVVKVVKVGRAHNIEKVVLPIRSSKLSVQKFTFFTVMALAYNAKAEIYSVDKVSRFVLTNHSITFKKKLQNLIFNLRHYLRLAHIFNFKFSLKHDFAVIEGERIKEHIATHEYDLIIVGGHHQKPMLFQTHPIDVLFEEPMVNTIYFIPYKDTL